MNPEVNFNPLKLRVDPENEITFDDKFWDSLNFVVNAVDNVKARLYVDSRCVWY
jgi:ubiquitin-activating enzyme E1